MATTEREKREATRFDAQFPLFPMFARGTFLDLLNPAAIGMTDVNGRAFAGLINMQREWLGFVSRRLQEDAALVEQIGKCTTGQEAYGIYAGFVQKALADYQREFAELARLGQAVAAETASGAQKALEASANAPIRTAA